MLAEQLHARFGVAGAGVRRWRRSRLWYGSAFVHRSIPLRRAAQGDRPEPQFQLNSIAIRLVFEHEMRRLAEHNRLVVREELPPTLEEPGPVAVVVRAV